MTEALCAVLNAALAEARTLPRVVPQPQEVPDFTGKWIAAQREQGWFGEGLRTSCAEGRVIALVDVRVEADQAVLGWFATHPDHRRKGHASDCLRQALRCARERGATTIRTHAFIDSRLTPACTFLEKHGFTVRDPDHQNMVLQIDMAACAPRTVELPEGYRIASLQMAWLPRWMEAKNRIFGSSGGVEWFEHFSSRWDFDATGWQVLFHDSDIVGIAGADFHGDPARPDTISGCQIEFVGVLEEHRGKRLGEALMLACLNHTQRHNVKPCQLITQRFRTAAVALYEKLGFRFVRENRVYEKSLIHETP